MKATLLTVNETFGKYRLDIMREKGTEAKATDFAKATGVWVNDEGYTPYYLKTPYNGYVRIGYVNGSFDYRNTTARCLGVRPVLEFSSIDEIFKYGGEFLEGNKLKFGTYSKTALQKNDQIEWTDKLNSGMLEGCSSSVIDGAKYNDDCEFNPVKVPIYEYNGKRTKRIKINSSFGREPFILSNGQSYKNGEYVWFEINDMIWDFDEENLKAISQDVILGGIPFDNNENNYHDEKDFPNINMGKYLNDVFLPELLQFQNITYDNEAENMSLDEVKELLCRLKNNNKYIKYLEEENDKYKKFLDEVNANLENVVDQINRVNVYKPQN